MTKGRVLIGTAIRYPNGEIVKGFKRHYKIIRMQAKLGIPTHVDAEEQGFYDSADNFLTRSEAKPIAIKSGQLNPDHKGTLYSEDLWTEQEAERDSE